MRISWIGILVLLMGGLAGVPVSAQPAGEGEASAIRERLAQLQEKIKGLQQRPELELRLPDVEIHAKGAEWILRHAEFYRPDDAQWTLEALQAGLRRAAVLEDDQAPWDQSPGRTVLGYRSAVDDSVQPLAVTLPDAFGQEPERRWPLHVVLHGRDGKLSEISFIHAHSGQAALPDQDWIQLDVFGRTNNAYRWAGESDVLEGLAEVRRRYRIDPARIVLHGFSMGGAGSWHLGLHHPSLWCSVGPGAGFVDFYKYQKVDQPLPSYQDLTLPIYNPSDVALNAFNVPICTYGGELDEQLVASTDMVARGKELGVPMKLLIGPGVGHRFHPESLKEFMDFHRQHQSAGRPAWSAVREVKFVTHTLKYNACEWVTIEEQLEPYRPSIVEARVDDETGRLVVRTTNVAVLQVARDVADEVELDGDRLPLLSAAEGLLPGVYYEGGAGAWHLVGYTASLGFSKNIDRHKRHNLQGPIDDAFMQPFVCVRGTGTAWNADHTAWASWVLERFAAEFDKGFRARVPIVNDSDVTQELAMTKNLILFGDPGSNSVLAKVLPQLPVKWTREALEVHGERYDPATHGVSLIFPNPMAPRRYVVVNSGHTFHAEDFQKSNAWLFPRLGDIAVQRFQKQDTGGYREEVVWAGLFDRFWKLPR
ncbi:MAG: prolyl oligopeptidase family serine peptidase [Planctomycetales bacterium]